MGMMMRIRMLRIADGMMMMGMTIMSRFKSHFRRKFSGKMPQTKLTTLIKHRPLLVA